MREKERGGGRERDSMQVFVVIVDKGVFKDRDD